MEEICRKVNYNIAKVLFLVVEVVHVAFEVPNGRIEVKL